jgi:endonuclease/exonuclease/phosphatase family metal-dependent hydrolase
MSKRHLTLVAYNLDNNRNPTTVIDEVEALLEHYRPDVAAFSEADYHLQVDGYRTVRRGKGASRRNIAILVRRNRRVWRKGWVDLRQTWTRTEHPGRHWPRSFQWVRTAGTRVIAVHQAPPYVDNTQGAQSEGLAALVKLMRGDRPSIAIGDFNRRRGEPGPGPDVLADAVLGRVVGGRVDCAVVKGWDVESFDYPESVQGLPLKSDHGHALVVRLTKKEK